MKKSFMTRVLAVTLSAAMAFSVSSASNLVTASAASTVKLHTTFKTLKVNQKYELKLKSNTLNWKITKVTTTDKTICTVYGKKASSVMLKGKGVGRAKIKVKVKTTKRKYPKNIKYMTCTAKVVAATDNAEKFTAEVAASSNTAVKVTFSKPVDDAKPENFTVSGSVKVADVKLSEDKRTADLTIDGAEYGKKYDLTVTGIKVAGAAQDTMNLSFTVPEATELYDISLVPEKSVLKSDGQTTTIVTFTIKDRQGNLVKDKGVEVEFAAAIGKFAENRVAVENGEAKIMYRSEVLTATQVDKIVATIVESTSNKELQGIRKEASITLTPNPEAMNTSLGAIITSVSAPTADRVIAYFDKEVHASDFLKNGKLDSSKFECTVTSGLDNNNYSGTDVKVVGIEDVDNEPNALQLLVASPLVDNTNVRVKFTNKISATTDLVKAENTVYCVLTDARRPAVLGVESNGVRELKVTFSEAVLRGLQANTWTEKFAADNPSNYLVDGKPLSYYGITPEVASGESFYKDGDVVKTELESNSSSSSKVKKVSEKKDDENGAASKKGTIKVGKDGDRHIVTITLGRENILSAGAHSLEVANVGDWAANTDNERNIVNTQLYNFEVTPNTDAPAFTVTEESPEQWTLDFNCEMGVVSDSETFTTRDTSTAIKSPVLRLQEQINGQWVDISDSDGSGKNPIRVSEVTGDGISKKYQVEVRKDWTDVYNTSGTRQNYYNKTLRLHVDAGKLVNLANDYKNAEINVMLDGTVMKTPDTVNPDIKDVERAKDDSGADTESYNVTLTEPVKMSASANKEGLTPSQTQQTGAGASGNAANNGVPVPSAQFISSDNAQTIPGRITDNEFIDASDTIINIEPESTLGTGTWKLVLTSISDDVGNTTPTATRDIVIERPAVTTDFKVVWSAVSNKLEYDGITSGWGNYIFVKFSKPVNMTGNSVNAGVTANYTINGDPLPVGTTIRANIKGYDDHDGLTDSVTICLPDKTNWQGAYGVNGSDAVLNISKALTAYGSTETLSNGGAVKIPFQYGIGNESSTGTGYAGTTQKVFSNVRTQGDAVWGNHESEKYSGAGATVGYTTPEDYYRAFKEALESDKYREVIFDANVTTGVKGDGSDAVPFNLNNLDDNTAITNVFGRSKTLTINRAIEKVDFGGITINGNVVISTSDTTHDMVIANVTINGSDTNKKDDVSLRVNTPNIYHTTIFEDVAINKGSADQEYAVELNDVFENSFYNKGNINGGIVITDANKGSLVNAGNIYGDIAVATSGEVSLRGDYTTGNVANIFVNGGAKLYLGKDKEAASTFSGNTNIEVKGAGAWIILDEDTAKATKDGKLDINVTGKNIKVKVTLPDIPTINDYVEVSADNNASVTFVDNNGKEVSNPVVVDKTGMELALKQMSVVSGASVTVDAAAVESASAVKGAVALNVASLVDKFKNTKLSVDGDEPEGNEASYAISATYTLDTTKAFEVVKDSGKVVSFKAKDDAAVGASDKVTVTLICNGVKVTKTVYLFVIE